MFDQLELSKICILNVAKLGILRLNIQHDLIFSIWFMKDPRDILRQTSPGVVSIDECAFHLFHTWEFSCCWPQFITVNKQETSNQHPANCGTVRNHRNLQLHTVGLDLSRTCMWAVIDFIFTWSLLSFPDDFPLLLIITFLSFSTAANHVSTNTTARWELIQIKPSDQRFIQWATHCETVAIQPPVS